tara:strand:+ start:4391 stop:6574 length:2184 start_codon:yes stop_codon:yes gene_type:complete
MLQKLNFKPGFNKQVTESGAESQWIDGDFVRFRYGLPEKIGGWTQLTNSNTTLPGVARAQHAFTSLTGERYVAIGTSQGLFLYYEGEFFDITPIDNDVITGADFDATSGSATVTVNKTSHGLQNGRYVTFSSVTVPTGSGYATTDFTNNSFEVLNKTANTFQITMPSNSAGSTSGTGSAQIDPYVNVGPTFQTVGLGWGTAAWGGSSGLTTTLNGALLDDANGTGGSGTSITLTSTANFPTTGTIKVGAEYISYTGISGNNLTGITRAAAGTRSAHSNGATVEYYIGWGQSAISSTITLDPGLWSLDNFGQILIATIHNGETFTWNAGAASARNQRATIMTNAPTKSRLTQVSDRDRHVFHFGTETTIGDTTTQDPMFIRFSDQENFNEYEPTAINTAGTFRLDKGNEIVGAVSGKDYTLVLTDTAAYVIQYVGPPFTFSVRQVGTNCGLIGQNALSYSDGIVFWMSGEGGFFMFDGTVKAIPCLVEDFVFTTRGDNLGINYNSSMLVYAEHNSLYNEISWFYPTSDSQQINRCVVYNYAENLWTTSSLARTSYIDTGVYDLPYATEYDKTALPTFSIQGVTATYGATTYYEHEKGTDQINSSGTTSIDAFIQSGDFDISARQSALGQTTGAADLRGDGEFIISMKRFIPDFKVLNGNSKVTLLLNNYPSDTASSSPLGPFTITSSTDKVDTRARGRLLAIKIENNAVGETWRYGTLRVDIKPDGRR